MKAIYLDHCATTPIRAEVLECMLPFLRGRFGNPSSIHAPGRTARAAVEEARERVARLIGAKASEIYFTSGGTEANNLAIQGTAMAFKDKGNHIITSAIEHHAVLKTCEFLQSMGFHVTFLPVDGRGSVNLKALKKAITRKTILISIMHANNEVGTIQPVEEIGQIAAEKEVLIHSDAVQTAGKVTVNVEVLCADLLSLSAHKIYGPKGTGALYIREGVSLMPLLYGGHQEKNIRSGTENVAAIVGMGKACELALKEGGTESKRLENLRNLLQDLISARLSGVAVNGHAENRLPHVLSLSVPDLLGEDMVREMDKAGIALSAGSACTSEKVEISHVLSAMMIPQERARGTIRFSLGRDNTRKQIEQAAHAFVQVVERLKVLSELEDSLGKRRCY
jgi:cysteine desulfurase